MKKTTWKKLVSELSQANANQETKYAIIVFDPNKSNWSQTKRVLTEEGDIIEVPANYSFEECVYYFSSNEKYFATNMLGNSLYANCLEGADAAGCKINELIYQGKLTACYVCSRDELVDFLKEPRKSEVYSNFAV